MSLVPVTEEDKPAVEAVIMRLVRLRQRQTAQSGSASTGDLSDAIRALHSYGAMKGWWEYNADA